MKLAKDKYDRRRRQAVWNEARLKARYDSTSTAAAVPVDRNVKRQHCALDFDTLDCPICLESLFPPVYQCQNGHMACAGCCKMLDKGTCPSCALPIGTNRCIAVEKIIESLHVNCKYAVWGCKEMLQYASKRGEHEALCKFRPFICPIMGCSHEGLKSSLHQHFQSVHNVAEVEQPDPDDETEYVIKFLTKERAFDKWYSQYALIQAFEYDDEDKDEPEDGSLFLVHLQFHEKASMLSFACTSFGSTKTLTRYHLAVNLERTGGFRDKHSTEGPIHDNQVRQALLNNKGVQQGYLLVPRLHLPAKDSLLKVNLSLLEGEGY